jgi:hypothetical protein
VAESRVVDLLHPRKKSCTMVAPKEANTETRKTQIQRTLSRPNQVVVAVAVVVAMTRAPIGP